MIANAKVRKLAKTESARDCANSKVEQVRAHFPLVAKTCGLKGPKMKKDAEWKLKNAEIMIKVAFGLKGADSGFGIKPTRLLAFVSTLVEDLQKHGVVRMLYLCSRFRGGGNLVSLSYSHEMDSTNQLMRQERIQRLGRPMRKRLRTEVMYQKGKISGELLNVETGESALIDEDWICQPYVTMGKTAPFVVKCIEEVQAFDLEKVEVQTALMAAADVFELEIRSDKGSNNFPAMRRLYFFVCDNSNSICSHCNH